jgi:type IV secretory pathway component VirB8
MSNKQKQGILAINLAKRFAQAEDTIEEIRADTLTRKQRKERRLIIATILLAAFIIVSVVGIVAVLFLLNPDEVTEIVEQKDSINMADILRQAAEAMKGKR